ncbi:MAG: hypothetical protein MJ211_13285 [Bacteroidales bacterium]|nr:hypothetical protein [Bacteroidales bacterium]
MKKQILFLSTISLLLISCGNSNNNQKTEQASENSVEVSQNSQKKYVNWNKPLYSINKKGDTVEKWEYNEKGLLIKENSVSGNFTYQYDGTKVTVKDNDQNSTKIIIYKDETYKQIIDNDGIKYEYFEDGKLKTSTFENGRIANFDYNNRGDLINEKSQDYDIKYTYEYNDKGRLVSVKSDDMESTYEYDETTHSITENQDQAFITTIDSLGRIIYFDLLGAEGYSEEYEYFDNYRTCKTIQRIDTSLMSEEEELNAEFPEEEFVKTYYLMEDTKSKVEGYFDNKAYGLDW